MITYTAKLISSQENLSHLREILEWQRMAYNHASQIQFKEKQLKIKNLHEKFYNQFREQFSHITSQVVIRAEQECLSSYRSIKSNKHKIDNPTIKKNLSMRLDKRLYRIIDKHHIAITTSNKRQQFQICGYKKLNNLLENYTYQDPLLYIKNNEIYIALTFDIKPNELQKQKLALGVDLGCRIVAACSDGRLIRDKNYNKNKRKLRYLKRKLQSKKTKSSKRKLRKIKNKEKNRNKNQTHLIVNEILKTHADTIVIEDLKGIKKKKHKNQNKNRISQVPFFQLKTILSYKALNMGKHIQIVKPYYTSQDDCITGKRDGIRRGRRYYAKSGLIYDADLNAACNIGKKSKLPLSQGNLLDGAGSVVNLPNASGNYFSGASPSPCGVGN